VDKLIFANFFDRWQFLAKLKKVQILNTAHQNSEKVQIMLSSLDHALRHSTAQKVAAGTKRFEERFN
jgi:hypothetical protein